MSVCLASTVPPKRSCKLRTRSSPEKRASERGKTITINLARQSDQRRRQYKTGAFQAFCLLSKHPFRLRGLPICVETTGRDRDNCTTSYSTSMHGNTRGHCRDSVAVVRGSKSKKGQYTFMLLAISVQISLRFAENWAAECGVSAEGGGGGGLFAVFCRRVAKCIRVPRRA